MQSERRNGVGDGVGHIQMRAVRWPGRLISKERDAVRSEIGDIGAATRNIRAFHDHHPTHVPKYRPGKQVPEARTARRIASDAPDHQIVFCALLLISRRFYETGFRKVKSQSRLPQTQVICTAPDRLPANNSNGQSSNFTNFY